MPNACDSNAMKSYLKCSIVLLALSNGLYADNLNRFCYYSSQDCYTYFYLRYPKDPRVQATESVTTDADITKSGVIGLVEPWLYFRNNHTLNVGSIVVLGGSQAPYTNRSYNLNHFTNNGTINTTSGESVTFGAEDNSPNLGRFDNNGYISGSVRFLRRNFSTTVNNTGNMGGIEGNALNSTNIILNNSGTIRAFNHNGRFVQFANLNTLTITGDAQNVSWGLHIYETANTFNAFEGFASSSADTISHLAVSNVTNLVLNGKISVVLNATMFEMNKDYNINKLVYGSNLSADEIWAKVAFNDLVYVLYSVERTGNFFRINDGKGGGGGGGGGGGSGGGGSGGGKSNNPIIVNSPTTATFKSNIKEMNNLYLLSNKLIFKHKYGRKQNTAISGAKDFLDKQRQGENERILELFSNQSGGYSKASDESKSAKADEMLFTDLRFTKNSGDSLKSSESKAIISQRNAMSILDNSATLSHKSDDKRGDSPTAFAKTSKSNALNISANLPSSPLEYDKYYAIFTPLLGYNVFDNNDLSLKGLEFGFIGAFSGKIDENNTLGAHFAFSYGQLKGNRIDDNLDKNFNIISNSLMLGVHYKLDLIYDMFFKMRGDFFYFLNQVSSMKIAKHKPNSLGLGLGVAYGKDFDLDKGGVISIEIGADYKMLMTNAINVINATSNANEETYYKANYNMIYADLGVDYNKYFAIPNNNLSVGLNIGGGIRYNVATKLATATLSLLNNEVLMMIDNDSFLGYANAGTSIVLNNPTNAMEFSLNYYGNFGDKSMRNGGGFEFRIWW